MYELLKALRNNADHYAFTGNNGLVHLLTDAADVIEELIQRCEQFQYMPPPTWISIKNKIPKEKEEVLVVCKNGKMFVAEHLSNTYCNDGWNVIGPLGSKRRIGNNRVTHWIPLPQKPKRE